MKNALKHNPFSIKKISHRLRFGLLYGAHQLFPEATAGFLRKTGFRVPRYQLTEDQATWLSKAKISELKLHMGHHLRLYEWGEGPLVILAHGWGGRGLQLSSFIAPLLKRGFRVLAFDHKGHGESATHWSSFLEFILGTQTVLQSTDKVHAIVAHSMGASAALKSLEKMDQKVKLVAIAPMEEVGSVIEGLKRKHSVPHSAMNALIRSIEKETHISFEESRFLQWSQLEKHPILLVHDKYDRINSIDRSYEIHKALPQAELLETEGLGHSRILSDSQVIQKIAQFIEEKK